VIERVLGALEVLAVFVEALDGNRESDGAFSEDFDAEAPARGAAFSFEPVLSDDWGVFGRFFEVISSAPFLHMALLAPGSLSSWVSIDSGRTAPGTGVWRCKFHVGFAKRPRIILTLRAA
jgi:hypothetical protein